MSKDDYARAVIAEGQRRNITPRGIVIAIATCLVESNLMMWANGKVPESLTIPHDAVGSDGYSVGLFQQQVRKGNGGQWWWGSAADCMDPTKSAGMFYDRLSRLDYNGPNSPGSYAQAVQQSAFPTRYDQRMSEAQGIYNRLKEPIVADPNKPSYNEFELWTTNCSSRGDTKVDAAFIHTQEGGGGNSAAEDLAKFCRSTEGTANPVSYHYYISQASDGGVTVVDGVDTDFYSYSVLSANRRSINLCFAGARAGWTRDQWMKQANAIDVAAYLLVQDAKKYGFPSTVVAPPYTGRIPGISDHRYVTKVLGDGNHTDVGDQFPWDLFTAAVTKYASGAVTPPVTVPPTVPTTTTLSDRQLLQEVWDQLRGPGGKGWPQLGGKSLVDALAELLKDAS